MDILEWLMDWYKSNCDGDWEHCYNNVSINTLDNPGWYVKLNVMETPYEDILFDDVKIERTENDWVHCFKKDGNIECAGGSPNLKEMLEIIRKWMTGMKPLN